MNRKLVLLVIAMIVVGAGVVLYFYGPFAARPTSLVLPGIVKIQEVRLGSKIGGRVARVDVQEGAAVYPGQPLVTFEVPELESQRAQQQAKVDAAKADWDKAVAGPRSQEKLAALAGAKAAWAKYERMKAGWREEEKRQAAADLATARAEFKQAQEELDRVTELFRLKSSARAEFETALANRGRMEGKLNSFLARHEMLQTGNRTEDVQQALHEWTQAEENYKLLMAGTRDEDKSMAKSRYDEAKAKLAEIETNLREAVVYAPEKAIVEVIAVRKGDLVMPNQPVIRVLRAEDLWVEVFVPETELARVRGGKDSLGTGEEVQVTIDAFPNYRFKGVVTYFSPVSEFTPRNVQSIDERRHQVFALKIRVADAQGFFKAGLAASVRLPLAEAP